MPTVWTSRAARLSTRYGGLRILQKHQVDFNTLTVVSRVNSQKPLETYRFLRDMGSGFIQFIRWWNARPTPPFRSRAA
jgi:sulfatase maturation enzyme AslB (radical SAM superfamily)